ncbi:MAG: cobalamin biosynthesis protein CobD [Methylomonas sp.]|nr:cobalamin biosynthesis protein CobD [Methylomonas sp.]PPD21810.1 MAG: cobalamin biosynthesis protein CobD [Methylomonas sp.]PPD27495.1 MAG: cobalamin biosynthesis protein CobD [Methylomonas sp.]PPD39478.1 MAG: cobalamin biosynthesis protein CobD [Methylomonas sp.]PPD42278.1 MAG: cobalamin biosynthesis protein CobD [Methylomonas sp.]
MTLTLTLISALLLDYWLGEPPNCRHPLVAYGRFVRFIERHWRNGAGSPRRQKAAGSIAVLLALLPALPLVLLTPGASVVDDVCSAIVLYVCIAPRSLRQHARAVDDALRSADIDLARQRVAAIVSRDTGAMDADAIRRATIETVLENGADALFAALFWFIIAGPFGAVLYRLSNTLDAMWGYRDERYRHFGWAAARWDDVLNGLPARLTATSYALLGNTAQAFAAWRQQAGLLDSPNAGPVMTAGAGALGLKLGGPAIYHGQIKHKPWFGGQATPTRRDIARACRLVNHTMVLWLLTIAVLEFWL